MALNKTIPLMKSNVLPNNNIREGIIFMHQTRIGIKFKMFKKLLPYFKYLKPVKFKFLVGITFGSGLSMSYF